MFQVSVYAISNFHLFKGSLTLIWAILWFWLVYDTPSSHPTISKEELEYITKDKNTRLGFLMLFPVKSRQIENPQFSDEISFKNVCLTMWKLIKEPSVWTYIFVMCGQSYVFFQGLKLFPMFMSRQLNLDLASVGLLS